MTKKQAKTVFASEQAKNQSHQLKIQLNTVIDKYKQELQSLKKEREELEAQQILKDELKQITKAFQEEKEETLKYLSEREERILNMEKKLASSTMIETKLGKNQVVKLNIGGKVFATSFTNLFSIKDTFFTCYFNDHFNPTAEEDDNAYFIDRPFEQFHLILNYLRGFNIKQQIECLNESEMNDFIEEVVFYQITPIYELFPRRAKLLLKTKYNIVLDCNLAVVQFDDKKCSKDITLESPTRAHAKSIQCSVLGTQANSFIVHLISNCTFLMIGFAPSNINVNGTSNYSKCGYYLYCCNGTLYSQNGDYGKGYSHKRIYDGSIVECKLENGIISYTINGTNYGNAFSNVPNNLFPAFDVYGEGAIFELIND